MYGNAPYEEDGNVEEALTPEQRRRLEREVARVADRTRELLPGEFVVGSDLSTGVNGVEATVAVQPPVGSVVSAGYTPDGTDIDIGDDERSDIAAGLAASAALQVKDALAGTDEPTAR